MYIIVIIIMITNTHVAILLQTEARVNCGLQKISVSDTVWIGKFSSVATLSPVTLRSEDRRINVRVPLKMVSPRWGKSISMRSCRCPRRFTILVFEMVPVVNGLRDGGFFSPFQRNRRAVLFSAPVSYRGIIL